jgi:hypothetical protein
MAFSGQYAAAQLHKLDNSSLFRGYTFPLAAEVSAYLGNVNALVPPTLLHWSRQLGRLVAVHPVPAIIVLTDELDGLDCEVMGSYTVFNGTRWIVERATCTMDEHHREGHTPIFDAMINTPATEEDRYFYARWFEVYGNRWPDSTDNMWHPTIRRLVHAFHYTSQEYMLRGNRRFAEMHRMNRTILFPNLVVESGSESDSELQSDEEL